MSNQDNYDYKGIDGVWIKKIDTKTNLYIYQYCDKYIAQTIIYNEALSNENNTKYAPFYKYVIWWRNVDNQAKIILPIITFLLGSIIGYFLHGHFSPC